MEEKVIGKYLLSEQGVFDRETGEKLNIKIEQVIQLKEKEITNLLEELNLLGDREYVLVTQKYKEINCINIKKSYYFGKLFRTILKKVIQRNTISKNSAAFMFYIAPFVCFPYNYIQINKEVPTIKDLKKITKMSDRSINSALVELEELGIIKRVKTGVNSLIYINPFLYCNGLVDVNTYNIFEDSKFNPYN